MKQAGQIWRLVGAVCMLIGCTPSKKDQQPMSTLEARIARFAPTEFTGDISKLSPGDRAALSKLIEATRIIDSRYLRQKWSGSQDMLARLRQDTTREGKERLQYFLINMGPWSKLDGDSVFIEGAPAEKPAQANYYPADMTKEEFTSWLATLPASEQKK